MAKHEQDREDLLREATALVARVELQLPHHSESVVVGFRAGGAASVYFGADRVYHFTTDGHLRRAYMDGTLYKAVGGRLVEMRRQRAGGEVRLVSRQLGKADQEQWIHDLVAHLTDLLACCSQGNYQLVGQVPGDAKLIERVEQWAATTNDIGIADAPNLK